MEITDLDDEINHCEQKLKCIDWEYNNSMTKDWPKIREKELFLIREIARLKMLKKEKRPTTSSSIMLTDNIKLEEKRNDKVDENHKNKEISEEEQWDINNKLLLESYEEKKLMSEPHIEDENYDNAEQDNNF